MKIEIKGPIISDSEQWIYDWFEIPATSPSAVSKMINKASEGEELEILINSGGGSVFSGSEIYTTLKDYEGDVTVKITGIAASAASVIAMAGTKVMMSPTAQLMIHNASGTFQGDHNDMAHGAELLKGVNESIANAYMIKTGMEHKDLLEMMNKETYMTSQRALENKFIDEVMFQGENRIVASVDANGMLPQQVIDKIRNDFKGQIPQLKNEPALEPENDFTTTAKAKLNLLINL